MGSSYQTNGLDAVDWPNIYDDLSINLAGAAEIMSRAYWTLKFGPTQQSLVLDTLFFLPSSSFPCYYLVWEFISYLI